MAGKLQNYLEGKKKEEQQNKGGAPLQMEALLTQIVGGMLDRIKTLKGDPGEDGHTPTEKELRAIIEPLIDQVMPKNDELERMIKALIPPVQHGKTPVFGKDYFNKAHIEEFIKRSTPILGKHYFNGKDGAPGRPGKDADLPDLEKFAVDIINVLEMMKDDDRLDAKALKNLEPVIEQFVRKLISEETIGLWGKRYNEGGPGVIFTDKTTILGSGEPGDPLRAVPQGTVTFVDEEEVAGSGTLFTLAFLPIAGSVKLYARGQRLTILSGDYSIIGKTITPSLSWSAGDLYADYRV